jgi:pimeloyl-ACP methyl ester carboxylesterase
MWKLRTFLLSGCLVYGLFLGGQMAFQQASGPTDPGPTPKELWERFQKTLPPLSYNIIRDEAIPSDSAPGRRLRRLEVRFCSQVAGQWRTRMEHTAVILLPNEPRSEQSSDRKGKVVVVSHAHGDQTVEGNYGEPIAARMGYPTMVIPIPGEYDGCGGESAWIYFCRSLVQDTNDPINTAGFRQAVAYLRALDVFGAILGKERIQAVIGGHSKRATSAFLAAAMDPERVVGVVYMGNESRLTPPAVEYLKPVSGFYAQSYVRCPVIYLGATNEDGYEMFNINRIQDVLEKPWTVAYIPNYRHANRAENQFIDWQMWISHCYEGRPITQIRDLSYEETEEGTLFRCRIVTANKIIMAKVWYVFCDDIPYWRDLMWHPVLMQQKEGDLYEGHVLGILPDAWLVEIKDTALGYPGYITSLPQDITHKETKQRYSQGSRSRHWRPKTAEDVANSRIEPEKAIQERWTWKPIDAVSPTPPELWETFRKSLPPFEYKIIKDEIVRSHTAPEKRLRRVEVEFLSQVIDGKRMDHQGVIFMPPDTKLNESPERRGRVVIIAHDAGNKNTAPWNYAEPIAARTGYPAMALQLPGDYDGVDDEVTWLYYFRELAKKTNDPMNHDFFRSAVPYIQAIDLFSGILREKNIRAIIGGHSKRAFYAYNAAAIDPQRVASVIYMGCEALYTDVEKYPPSINPVYIQDFVKCPVFYIGGTDEGGYEMFNLSRLQGAMKRPWAIEYIPNYRHEARSEKHFMDWQMWTSYIFDGRPITKISGLDYEETPEGTIFRAHVDTPNKIIQAKVWYVYCDDVPFWRDLVWYPVTMQSKEGTLFEGYVEGILPDAWLVEVKDIANGFPGYISSLPQDITHKETQVREPHFSGARLWKPKESDDKKN